MIRHDRWRKHRRNHAKLRASERYHLRLTNQDLDNIVGMIRNNQARPLRRLSCSKSIKQLRYLDIDLIVIYSHRHNEVITFLPADYAAAKDLEAACV